MDRYVGMLYALFFLIPLCITTSDSKKGEGDVSITNQVHSSEPTNNSVEATPSGDNVNEKNTISPVKMYQRLFRQKRAVQKEAIMSIVSLGSYEKQYKMVSMLLHKMFTVLSEAQVKLMQFGFTPGNSFPTNETVREALSVASENTAFFGDILLRLPDITHALLEKNPAWRLTAGWAVSFCNETQFFEKTEYTLFNLMAQEMNLVERDANYVNPYREETKLHQKLQDFQEQQFKENAKRKEKKKKKKKGPRLSHVEL